jgi:hypothetical protein
LTETTPRSDPRWSSGIKSCAIYYRPSTSSTWKLWKTTSRTGYAYFTGKPGVTYYFKVKAVDRSGNAGWSKVSKTIVLYNEINAGMKKRAGFPLHKYTSSGRYLNTVRYSSRRGDFLVYQFYHADSIGLVATVGPNRGRAKIFVDGKYIRTVDACRSTFQSRQTVFCKTLKKGVHRLKIVNLGTVGRPRFDVDPVIVGR